MWSFWKGNHRSPGKRVRREERMACELITSQYGRVLDLSPGGLRVHGRGKCDLTKGKVVPVTLKCAHGTISLMGQVAWSRKSSLGGYEAGIQFHGVKPQTAALIRQLAQFGFLPHMDQGSSSEQPVPGGQATFEDPYTILGIDASVADAQVQAAYRRLAREFHPDHNASPDAPAKFERVTRAYQTIKKRRGGFGRRVDRAA